MNKSKTGNERMARIRKRWKKWRENHAHGLSMEGLMDALDKGYAVIEWKRRPVLVRKGNRVVKKFVE